MKRAVTNCVSACLTAVAVLALLTGATGALSADGSVIYRALDLKVGLFREAAPQANGA